MNMNCMQKKLMSTEKTEQVAPKKVVAPRVNIHEDDDGIVLTADMPGVQKTGLDIHIDDTVLSISGKIQLDFPNQMNPIYSEFWPEEYSRSFTLHPGLNAENTAAQLKDGVLTLRIPKAETAKPKKIEVQRAP